MRERFAVFANVNPSRTIHLPLISGLFIKILCCVVVRLAGFYPSSLPLMVLDGEEAAENIHSRLFSMSLLSLSEA